ncbi:MAG: aspartate aminotransferase family protein [Verrucomicrobiota bacterium]|jgi:4-aminobutyrate aminotransferase/(S)-3-amino-2-methylpropionate transaminase|nr:aspartate aminotransferase family protein [Verrucomicrobiota bacterium]
MPGAEINAEEPLMVTRVPGPKSHVWLQRLARVESPDTTYVGASFPLVWEAARGVNVWDVDGNRFVDLTSAFGVAGWGHAHPRLVDAMQRQAADLMHGMGDVHPPRVKVELAERLIELGPPGMARVVFGLSGSDAVEAALKTARIATGRRGVLAFSGGYHGLGYGALNATSGRLFRRRFLDQLGGFVEHLPYPSCYRCPWGLERGTCSVECLSRLRARVIHAAERNSVGAVLVEPIQGRGGERIPPRGFLRMLREVCDHTGMVLILDEIYTGFGRVGRAFACEEEGVTPDLICLGKGLTGGFPLSACLGREAVMEAWPRSRGEAIHTTTFLGHPVGCAVGLAALGLFEEGLDEERRFLPALDWAAELEGWAEAAGRLPGVGEIRGAGAMWGIEMVDPSTGAPDGDRAWAVVLEMMARGYLVLPSGASGEVVSLTPPFVMPSELRRASLAALRDAICAVAVQVD